MDIMELGAIGELVGGVAVLATLIYLAIQVRQNSAAIRTTGQSQMVEPLFEQARQVVQDPDIARIVHARIFSEERLSDVDEYRFQVWASMTMYGWENLYRAFEAGAVSRDSLLNSVDNMTWPKALRTVLGRRPGPTSKRFVAFIEAHFGDFEEQ